MAFSFLPAAGTFALPPAPAHTMVSDLFTLQPPECRQPLPPRKVSVRGRAAPVLKRVLAFDPAPVYEGVRFTARPHLRLQVRAHITLAQLFSPQKAGLCDCGCGKLLTKGQRRWAARSCSDFVWLVYAVIAGRRAELQKCLNAYYGKGCVECGIIPEGHRARRGHSVSGIEYDHIIPVQQGGGACWLSNYRPLCRSCHREKTLRDRRAAMSA